MHDLQDPVKDLSVRQWGAPEKVSTGFKSGEKMIGFAFWKLTGADVSQVDWKVHRPL